MEELQALVSSLQVSLELQQRENQSLREELAALKQKLPSCHPHALPSPSNSRSRLNEMRDSLKLATRSRQSSPANSLPGTPRPSAASLASPVSGLLSRLRLHIPLKENAFFPSSPQKTQSARSSQGGRTPLRPSTSAIPLVLRASDETKKVDRLMERRGYLRKFEKIGPGSYRYGSRRVFVTVRNERLMVRDGNAFVAIEQFANLEKLASIPFASHRALAFLCQRVASDGPCQASVVKKLLGRADAILDSLDAKDAALILNALAKIFRDPAVLAVCGSGHKAFVNRLVRKKFPTLLEEAAPQNLVLIAHALGEKFPINFRDCATTRMEISAPAMDAQQVALATATLAQWGQAPPEIFLTKISDLSQHFAPKGLTMALEGLAANCRGVDEGTLKILAEISDKIDAFDARGCALVLNCLAKAAWPHSVTAETFSLAIGKFKKFPGPSLRELALVANAAVRREELSECAEILAKTRSVIGKLDVQSSALLLNAAAKCGIVDTAMIRKFIEFSDPPTDAQRAMMLHALGKIGISEFRDFASIMLRDVEVGNLSSREFFMTLYGAGRLRLLGEDSRGAGQFLARLKVLLSSGGLDVDTALFLYRKYLRPAHAQCPDLEALCLERRSQTSAAVVV